MKALVLTVIISLNLFAQSSIAQDEDGFYRIGTGIGDVTGPAAGVVLNGYVNPITLAAGIHTRLYARSFIVESITNGKNVVFVSCDLGMFDHGLKLEVIKKLRVIYGDKYTEKNVQISATHTHSSPSGFMQYYAYLVIESYGFNPLTFWAIVDGIVESIEMADNALTRGRIFLNKGDLLGYNGNRASEAYLFNPEEERAKYADNVDKEMISLKFEAVDDNGSSEPIGSFNWWPVHPISFNDWDNPLVSSDNRGYASVKFDYEMNKGESARPGRGKFVSAFAASNLGDVNPRTPGRLNVTEKLEKVAIVGQAQFQKAFELFNDVAHLSLVKGPIDFVQQYVDMPKKKVTIPNPDPTGVPITKDICKAALGYAFVGLDPEQKDFWDRLLHLIHTSSNETVECQKPKLVAIAAGEMTEPWDWAPSIVDLNILRVGNIHIVSVPGEFTTMSGRRLKRHIEALIPEEHQVIISGLANNYINYIATPEEYAQTPHQDSAAGATLFGPYTLNAIIESQELLMTAMLRGESHLVDPGTAPPNFIDRLRPKIKDRVDILPQWPTNAKWGATASKLPKILYPGETLFVRFVTPSLRHNPLRGNNQSHFLIQVRNEKNEWTDVRTDADLDTTFWWNAKSNFGSVYWFNIPNDIPFGTYRVYHSGYYLDAEGEEPKPFNGETQTFQIMDIPSTTAKESSSTQSSTPIHISSLSVFAVAIVIMTRF